MRIAIDATPLLAQPTGVGTFVAGLISSLCDYDNPAAAPAKITGTSGTIEVVEYAHRTSQSYRNWLSGKRQSSAAPRQASNRAPRQAPRQAPRHMLWLPPSAAPWVWRYLKTPIERKLGPLDVVHGTSFMVPPAKAALRVVTVHDLTYLMDEEAPRRVRWWDHYVRDAIKTGAVVHTQSQYVADEVIQHYGAPHVGVVRPSVQMRDSNQIAALKQASMGDGRADQRLPYILALGFSQPRKRLPLLVSAFEQVHQQMLSQGTDCQLLVVGPPGLDEAALVDRIEQLPVSTRNRVVRRGWVPPQERDRLLASATVLAFPSVYEGFGYPALEAMALEVPVVAARAGSLPEAVGDAAVLVAPDDVEALAAGLAQVLSDAELRSDLVRRGNAHVGAHSPQQAAVDMVAMYNAHA